MWRPAWRVMFQRHARLTLALSGGLDSVVLLHA